jgi:hypothetical protein
MRKALALPADRFSLSDDLPDAIDVASAALEQGQFAGRDEIVIRINGGATATGQAID